MKRWIDNFRKIYTSRTEKAGKVPEGLFGLLLPQDFKRTAEQQKCCVRRRAQTKRHFWAMLKSGVVAPCRKAY
jgi:hypothetical protein